MASESLLPEIIREILLKLPVESLLRCKSVCKEWYSLISDRQFIKAHYSLSSSSINFAHIVFIFNIWYSWRVIKSCPLNDVLFGNSVNNAFEYPFKCNIFYHEIRIVGSCNGLICIDFKRTIYICNPSTRIFNRLYWSFKDPRCQVFGFGYDEFNDDYKVVAIVYSENKVRIYSLKTGKWKNICDFPNDYQLEVPAIFSNGALHWADINSDLGSSNPWKIFSLDLTKETYGEVLQPEYDKGDIHLELGALGKWLCVLCNYFNSHADLWVMKVYGVKDSWTKWASIPCDPLRDQLSQRFLYDSELKFSDPLCISNDGKVLLQFGDKYCL